jgi:flagellar biosynthetic protein FliQ
VTPNAASELIRQTLMTALWVSAPLLAVGFVAGIVVSLIQIVTSIQDSGFSAVPRLGALLAALLLFLPWMLLKLMAFTAALFSDLGRYAR